MLKESPIIEVSENEDGNDSLVINSDAMKSLGDQIKNAELNYGQQYDIDSYLLRMDGFVANVNNKLNNLLDQSWWTDSDQIKVNESEELAIYTDIAKKINTIFYNYIHSIQTDSETFTKSLEKIEFWDQSAEINNLLADLENRKVIGFENNYQLAVNTRKKQLEKAIGG